jgi:hypothetical protein
VGSGAVVSVSGQPNAGGAARPVAGSAATSSPAAASAPNVPSATSVPGSGAGTPGVPPQPPTPAPPQTGQDDVRIKELTDLRQQLAVAARDIEHLKDTARAKGPWYREASVIISILALLASVAATVLGLLNTGSDRDIQARSRLSTIIGQLNTAQQQLQDPLKGGSADVRLLAQQAEELMREVPASTVEKLVVAQALVQAGLDDRAAPLAKQVEQSSSDLGEVVTATRLSGLLRFRAGDLDGGRAAFQRAVQVFEQPRFAGATRAVRLTVNEETQFWWASAEFQAGQCAQARRHMNESAALLDQLPPGNDITAYRQRLTAAEATLNGCR